jgi:hypothetical protein
MKLKKTNIIFLMVVTLVIALGMFAGCKKSFLDFTPIGSVSAEQLNTPDKINGLCTAAYAYFLNGSWGTPYNSQWLMSGVRSDDAYKGGGSVADQGQMHNLEVFSLILTNINTANSWWGACYNGIGRTNQALRFLDKLTVTQFPLLNVRKGEMRFLRGHYMFLAKVLFKYVPVIEYKYPVDSLKNISNRQYTDDELWNKIADDFQFAIDNLPTTQPEKGRANKYAAQAYLAKVRLYQAYVQDEQNNVTSINQARLNEVVTLCDAVIASGRYSLFNDFGKNFVFGYENGVESIFAAQASINDGTTNGRLMTEDGLNYPVAPEFGCCGFYVPSQNMVNAFRTGADGLPVFNTFNDVVMKNPADFLNNTFDVRLDHTVGITTHPFKYRPTYIYQNSWARAPSVYGYFSTMKQLQLADSPVWKKVGAYPYVSQNVDLIRYDDLLLWKAEALIELNRASEALPIINQIRTRAAASTGMIKKADGTFASNYLMNTYVDGVNCTWTQAYAREALRFERRLEFAMESPRFFDLVRWGIAAETLNAYFAKEMTRYSFLSAANFTKGRDEYLPIPQTQIDLVEGLYQQNNGW